MGPGVGGGPHGIRGSPRSLARRRGLRVVTKVSEVALELVRHPVRLLVHRWHWKGATLSAAVRGSLFFATNLSDGLGAAVRATIVECMFGVPLVGLLAA